MQRFTKEDRCESHELKNFTVSNGLIDRCSEGCGS